jgi:hypothetical protein
MLTLLFFVGNSGRKLMVPERGSQNPMIQPMNTGLRKDILFFPSYRERFVPGGDRDGEGNKEGDPSFHKTIAVRIIERSNRVLAANTIDDIYTIPACLSLRNR